MTVTLWLLNHLGTLTLALVIVGGTVVEVQWPLMRNGAADYSVTGAKLEALYDALQAHEPVTESQKIFYAQASSSGRWRRSSGSASCWSCSTGPSPES